MRSLVYCAARLCAVALLTFPLPHAHAQERPQPDAIARELTVFVPTVGVTTDAISRELTIWVTPSVETPDANSRELTFWAPASEGTSSYSVSDAVMALRVAAGMVTASPTDAARLNVVLTGPTLEAVTLADAARILRLSLHLER